MHYDFTTRGVCSRQIAFDINEGRLENVAFTGGCDGNLKAIATLVEGMDPETVVKKCSGITCGRKATSCGDQLAEAVKKAMDA